MEVGQGPIGGCSAIGKKMAFFQSLRIVVLLIVMFNNRAKYGIIASSLSFRISPETLSGPTDLFLPIAANFFLMILVLMAKGSPELARSICLAFSIESVMSRPLPSLIAGIFPQFFLRTCRTQPSTYSFFSIDLRNVSCEFFWLISTALIVVLVPLGTALLIFFSVGDYKTRTN
jgi:hypothetical protein